MWSPDPQGGWFRVGHFTDTAARTGCTVILFDRLSPACVDVRGGAPGTRETDALGPGRLVGRVDAILLTGGSAFGLAAADGVMRFLSERGRGVPTSASAVPIVPAAVIFDLAHGAVRAPDAENGYAAAATAAESGSADIPSGRVGAGTGATVAKLGGSGIHAGLGVAAVNLDGVTVLAIVALNALGDIMDPGNGRALARSTDPTGRGRSGRDLAMDGAAQPRAGENTTIGAILISEPVDRDTLTRSCVAAHDALARCVRPAHTLFDGDTFFAVAPDITSVDPARLLAITCAAEVAVERAIVSLFSAPSLGESLPADDWCAPSAGATLFPETS